MTPLRTLRRASRLLPLLGLAACDGNPAGTADAAPVAQVAAPAAAVAPAVVRREIEAANATLIASFLRADAEAATAHFTDDAVLMLAGTPLSRGHAEIRGAFEGMFSAVRFVDVQATILEVQLLGDVALETGTTRFVMEIGGQRVVDRGKYMVAWKRQPNGRWLIHRDVSNSSGPGE